MPGRSWLSGIRRSNWPRRKRPWPRALASGRRRPWAASLLRPAGKKAGKAPAGVDYVREAEKRLTDCLGRGVRFVGGQKKGRIQLEFYSADDREALMEALMRMDKPWKKKQP